MKNKCISIRKDRPLDALSKSKLERMLISGKTYQEIGDEYGVTKQAIYAHAFKFDLHELKRNIVDKRQEMVHLLISQEVAPIDIAKKIGVSISHCYRVIKGSL